MKRGASATTQQSVQDAKRNLQRFLRKLDSLPTKILAEEAGILYGEIIAEVPVDTGALERSVKVSVARDKKRPGLNASASARSKRGYNYAGIQHENESFEHSKPGAKDHFISDPFNRAAERIKQRLREELTIED